MTLNDHQQYFPDLFFFFNNNYGNVVWYQFRGIIATHKNFLKSQEAFKALI